MIWSVVEKSSSNVNKQQGFLDKLEMTFVENFERF